MYILSLFLLTYVIQKESFVRILLNEIDFVNDITLCVFTCRLC